MISYNLFFAVDINAVLSNARCRPSECISFIITYSNLTADQASTDEMWADAFTAK